MREVPAAAHPGPRSRPAGGTADFVAEMRRWDAVIDAPDLDAAAGWAAKLPVARHGSVEVHPTVGFELP